MYYTEISENCLSLAKRLRIKEKIKLRELRFFVWDLVKLCTKWRISSLQCKINFWMLRYFHYKRSLNLVCCICICRGRGTNCEFHDVHRLNIFWGGGDENIYSSWEDMTTMDILDHSNPRKSSVLENIV